MAQNKLSTAVLRKRNRNNIYRYFYESEKPCTKQEVATALTLSLPTVTQNLRELLDEGLIEYAGLVDSSGGRRPRTMRVCAQARFAVGVELSPKHIRLVAVDLLANVIAFEKHAIAFSNDAMYRHQMAQALNNFLDRFYLDRTKMLGIGITLPGIINEDEDMIEVIPVFGVRKMRLSLLTELLPYPVVVMNDANAGGFAEWWNHDTMETMAYLFVGKGVGGAILMEGKPYVETTGAAQNLVICYCGQRKTLQLWQDRLSGSILFDRPVKRRLRYSGRGIFCAVARRGCAM